MNGVPPDAPWSRRKWISLIVASFLAHLALILLLGERPGPPRPPGPGFQAALAESLTASLVQRPDFEDPALFALPNRRGFSGVGWMQLPALQHQYHEWSEEQRWLSLPAEELGQTFVVYVQDLTSRPLALTEKTPPGLVLPESSEPPDWLPQKSALRIEGALAARKLVRQPALPAWPCNDALARSEVQVVVDAQGRVIAATLLAESGLPAADRSALNLARECVFEKIPSSAPVFGSLIFEWATLPTNAPPARTNP